MQISLVLGFSPIRLRDYFFWTPLANQQPICFIAYEMSLMLYIFLFYSLSVSGFHFFFACLLSLWNVWWWPFKRFLEVPSIQRNLPLCFPDNDLRSSPPWADSGGNPWSVLPSVIDFFLSPALTPAIPVLGWVGPLKQEAVPYLSFLRELKMSGRHVESKFLACLLCRSQKQFQPYVLIYLCCFHLCT